MAMMDQLRQMSDVPPRCNAMLDTALSFIADAGERDDLSVVAYAVSNATWQRWQAWRRAEDNRQEHEWVVFANTMRIAESVGLTLTEKRIATAVAFVHDSCYIRRIMEQEIRDLDDEADRIEPNDPKRADELRRAAKALVLAKKKQRTTHMQIGARNAVDLLKKLKHPVNTLECLLTPDEIEMCRVLVSQHDMWKIPRPVPLYGDTLAVVCMEADALWPLHPIGVLADIERPDRGSGRTLDFSDPSAWCDKVKASKTSLTNREYRKVCEEVDPAQHFKDADSIFRTDEGHRLYTEWCKLWRI